MATSTRARLILLPATLLSLTFLGNAVPAVGDGTCDVTKRASPLVLNPDADVYIGSFLEAHHRSPGTVLGCGRPLTEAVEVLEVFKWALGVLNGGGGFVPGMKMGIKVYDSCGHKATAYHQLTSLFPELRDNSEFCLGNSSHVIGALFSNILHKEEEISRALREHNIPNIPLGESAMAAPEHLAKVILESAFDMKWERLVIFHSADEHSVAVVKSISQRVVLSERPCIVEIKTVPSHTNTVSRELVKSDLNSLLTSLEENSAVVVISSSSTGKLIVEAMAENLDSTAKHQWLFSWVPDVEAVAKLGTLLNSGKGIYCLAPYPASVKPFEGHWKALKETSSPSRLEDSWYLELVTDRGHCRIAGVKSLYANSAPCPNFSLHEYPLSPLVRTSRILPAVRGVFTLAQALKSAWSSLCNGQRGLCPVLRYLSRAQFVQGFLEPSSVGIANTTSTPGRSPKLSEDPLAELGMSHLALTRLVSNASWGPGFMQLIVYDGAEAKLLDKDIKILPAPCSPNKCHTCIRFRTSRLEDSVNRPPSPASTHSFLISNPEDVTLPMLLPIHSEGKEPYTCGSAVNQDAIQDLEAALWMADRVNSDGYILPGTKLRIQAIDTCSSPLILTREISAILQPLHGIPVPFLSALSKEESSTAASILSQLNITLIATKDIAPLHPLGSFQYQVTLPSEHIAEAMAQYLYHLDWTYVSMISSQSEQRAADAFKKQTDSLGVCLALEEVVNPESDMDSLVGRLKVLSARGSRGVILWTNEDDTSRVLAAVRKARQAGMQRPADIVLIHGSSRPLHFEGYEEEMLGSVLLQPKYGQVRDFVAYFERLKPGGNQRDKFFGKLWEQSHRCRTPDNCMVEFAASQSVVDSMQAVLTAATAIRNLRKERCEAQENDPIFCSQLLKMMKGSMLALEQHIARSSTLRVGDKQEVFSFTKHGHGDIGVELLNVRRSGTRITPQKGGSFHKGQVTETVPLVTYGHHGEEIPISELRSECSAACGHCQHKPLDFLLVPSPNDIYISASFPIHHQGDASPYVCSRTVSDDGILYLESFLWALDQINSSPSVLAGIKLGAVVFDTCGSREKTYRDVSNFVSDSLTSLRSAVRLPSLKQVYGFISGGHKATVEPVAEIMASVGVPTVVPTDTSTVLEKHSNVLRVSLPNDVVAKAILRLLKYFKWSYASVLYGEQENSMDIYEQLKHAVEQRGSNVRLSVALKVDNSADEAVFARALGQLIRKKKDGARVVILLLNDEQARTFFAHAKGPPTWGLTFIAVGLVETLSRFPSQTTGSLSILPSPTDVHGFKEYIQYLNYRNNARNPWFRSYLEQKSGCRGADSCLSASPVHITADAASVPSTVTSVYALASGIDRARKMTCRGTYCPDAAEIRGLLLNLTRGVHIPRHNGSMFKFEEGNHGNGILDVVYLQGSVAGKMAILPVGSYTERSGLEMNTSIPAGPAGQTLYSIKSSCEEGTNCVSADDAQVPTSDSSIQVMASNNAVFTIGAVLPIHKRGKDMFTCGRFEDIGTFQKLAALAYAIDQVNTNSTFPELQLSTVIVDYCGTKERAEEKLYRYFSSPNAISAVKPESLVSMLAFDRQVAKEIQPIMKGAGIPVVLTATNTSFGEGSWEVKLQTMPPMRWQVETLLGLLKHFDWTHIYVLYTSDDFGEDSYYQLTKSLERSGICVAGAEAIDLEASDDDVLRSVLKFTDVDVKVVLVFTEDKASAEKVIRAARKASLLERFIWVGTEGFSDNRALLDAIEGADVDVFALKLENDILPGFMDFLSHLTLGKHDPIPDSWFEEFWQSQFNCFLPNSGSVQRRHESVCTGRERLTDVTQDRYVYHTVETVEMIATALRNYIGKHCPYDAASLNGIEDCGEQEAREKLKHEINMALLNTDIDDCMECQPSHLTTFGYQLLKLNGTNARSYAYEKAGYFKNGLLHLNEEDIDFTTGVAPMSTCMRDCEERCPSTTGTVGDQTYLRQHRESLTGNFKTVWGIVVTALSLLGIILVIICALYFLMAFPVTVGTTILGYMILFGLLALYAVNFAFIVGATEVSCGLRRFLMGLAYSIIFSGMLVKVLNTWRLMGYHGNNRMLHDGTQLTSPVGLLVIASGLVVIQVVLTTAWLILMPPRIGFYERVWRCAPPASFEDELVVSMVYVMLLLAVTILFSILTASCRENNGESRWILACCIFVSIAWLVWTVLSTQLPLQYRDATIVVANLVCATLVMLCLYLRKVYLYNKLARQARDQEMKARLQPRGGQYAPSVYGSLHKGVPVVPVFYGSQASLTSKKLNGQFSRLSMDDLASDGSGSVQVQGTDLYPLEMYDGGSQFQPPSSLYGSMMMLDDNVAYAR